MESYDRTLGLVIWPEVRLTDRGGELAIAPRGIPLWFARVCIAFPIAFMAGILFYYWIWLHTFIWHFLAALLLLGLPAADLATGNAPPEPQATKNPAAVSLGKRGGLKGGPARAAKLSAAKRKAIAKKASAKRWRKDG